MSRENPLWGAPRIHGELLMLAIDVSEATVSRYRVRPTGRPSQTWRTFLRNHTIGIASGEPSSFWHLANGLLMTLLILCCGRVGSLASAWLAWSRPVRLISSFIQAKARLHLLKARVGEVLTRTSGIIGASLGITTCELISASRDRHRLTTAEMRASRTSRESRRRRCSAIMTNAAIVRPSRVLPRSFRATGIEAGSLALGLLPRPQISRYALRLRYARGTQYNNPLTRVRF